MKANDQAQRTAALDAIANGDVIAYPTESVYALGCDPFNEKAVSQLLNLKRRDRKKGFILIAADWSQVDHLIEPIEPAAMARVLTSWPGPVTWVFPCTSEVPEWIHGGRQSLAIRISDHPLCTDLCIRSGGPIISTSANIDGQSPARDIENIQKIFPNSIDCIIEGNLGERSMPTPILDAITGECLRQG